MLDLTLGEWDVLIRQARVALALPRLCVQLEQIAAMHRVPDMAKLHLQSARAHAAKHERTVRWEVNRIRHALRGLRGKEGVPIVLLKGAAYVMADLPPAAGRVVSDVDILVPRSDLTAVEHALIHAGWAPHQLDRYDQGYYRDWMHELPPLRHRQRGTDVDVHHTILPPTTTRGSDRPDPEKLIAASVPIGAGGLLRVLAPADMVLHSAVHLFHEGELEHGLRDLVDLDLLMRHFGADDSFWSRLIDRADEFGLRRPLYYALRYTHHFLQTPVPARVLAVLHRHRPEVIAPFMDVLFHRALAADHASVDDALTPAARWLLYVRAHHLRMPPHLLVPHLVRKAWRRRFAD